MKSSLVKKSLVALPVLFSLSSCGLHYQKAITLDEGRTLLNNAYTSIQAYDPNSRTSYSFSLSKEKMSGHIDYNRITDYDRLSGTYNYDVNHAPYPYLSFELECSRSTREDGEESYEEYSFGMTSPSDYVIHTATGDQPYDVETHEFLKPYFLNYPSSVYRIFSEALTSYLVGKMANIGVIGQENDLFGYTCLSTGNNDLVLILQSWDFTYLPTLLSHWTNLFSEEEGTRESFSSINFVEAHYEGGYLTTFMAGYDQEVDETMREEGLEERAKNIDDSYQVKITF